MRKIFSQRDDRELKDNALEGALSVVGLLYCCFKQRQQKSQINRKKLLSFCSDYYGD